eukprot:gene19348-biopygen8964
MTDEESGSDDEESTPTASTPVDTQNEPPHCILGGNKVMFKKHISILGMMIDHKLSWRQHCQATASKTRNALAAVRRAARHLRNSDRVLMVKALALPYVKLNQEVFEAATKTAKKKLERAYNACAREAAGAERTLDALDALGWPTYTEQQRASQSKVAMKIASQEEPRCLFHMLLKTSPPADGEIVTARRRAQVWECPEANHRLSAQSFAYWAPRRLQTIAEQDQLKQREAAAKKDQARARKEMKAYLEVPEIVQTAYEAELLHKYRDKTYHEEADGTVRVWTDGSAPANQDRARRTAGAGVFYGNGNELNKAYPVNGEQTNQRAELTAVIECIRNDNRRLRIATDSEYVMKGLTEWLPEWKALGWRRRIGKRKDRTAPVNNLDLWQELNAIWTSAAPGHTGRHAKQLAGPADQQHERSPDVRIALSHLSHREYAYSRSELNRRAAAGLSTILRGGRTGGARRRARRLITSRHAGCGGVYI